MIEIIAILMLALFLTAIIFISLCMLLDPAKAMELLREAGSTPLYHFGELSVRLAGGLGIFILADRFPYYRFFSAFGAFLIVTSAIIMLIPHRRHNAYAVWWAARLPHLFVRFCGLTAVLAALWLFHAFKFGAS